jgi:hypothetical protein
MRQETLKVGVSNGDSVKVNIELPETRTELGTVSKSDDAVLLRWGRRAMRIEMQERTGARDIIRKHPKKNVETDESYSKRVGPLVQKAINEYDPTASAVRGPVVKTVEVPKGSMTPQMVKQLEEQNVLVKFI